MFLFRNFVLSAPVAFTVALNMAPSVSAAPWWPMHFVMAEDPSAVSAASSLPLESTLVASTAIVSATTVPTAISSAIVESTPVFQSTDILPSADPTVSGIKDLSAGQTSGTTSIRGLGGTAAILGSTVTMLYLVL